MAIDTASTDWALLAAFHVPGSDRVLEDIRESGVPHNHLDLNCMKDGAWDGNWEVNSLACQASRPGLWSVSPDSRDTASKLPL